MSIEQSVSGFSAGTIPATTQKLSSSTVFCVACLRKQGQLVTQRMSENTKDGRPQGQHHHLQ